MHIPDASPVGGPGGRLGNIVGITLGSVALLSAAACIMLVYIAMAASRACLETVITDGASTGIIAGRGLRTQTAHVHEPGMPKQAPVFVGMVIKTD